MNKTNKYFSALSILLFTLGAATLYASSFHPFLFVATYKNFINKKSDVLLKHHISMPESCYLHSIRENRMHTFVCPEGEKHNAFSVIDNKNPGPPGQMHQHRTGEYYEFSIPVKNTDVYFFCNKEICYLVEPEYYNFLVSDII